MASSPWRYNALDTLLNDMQVDLIKKSNFDLPFGGTTDREFDFLAQNGAVNKMAPNFLSFMAGVAGANLATQQNRELQYNRATQLRDLNSTIDNRNAQTRNFLLEGDKRTAELPFAADQARATLAETNASVNSTNARTAQQNFINDHLQDQYNITSRGQRIANDNAYQQYLQNQFATNNLPEQYNITTRGQRIANDNAYQQYLQNQFATNNLPEQYNITTRGQRIANNNAYQQYLQNQFATNNQQALYDLDVKDRNLNYQNNQAIQQLNKFKADTAKELHDLNVRLDNKKITQAEYESQKAKKMLDYYEADRQLQRQDTQSQINLRNAQAKGQQVFTPTTFVSPNQRASAPVAAGAPATQSPSGYLTPPGSTAVMPNPVQNAPVMIDFNAAMGMPGITKSMIDLANSGRMKIMSQTPPTAAEAQAFNIVWSALKGGTNAPR